MYHRTLRWYNHITTLRFKDFPECKQIDNITLCALSSKRDVVIIHTDINTCNSYHQESQFIPYLSVNVP